MLTIDEQRPSTRTIEGWASRVVEIVLPAAADNGPAVVASEPRLDGRERRLGAVEAVVEQRHRSAAERAGHFAPGLERVLIILIERKP